MDEFKAGFVIYAGKNKNAHKVAFEEHLDLVEAMNPWLCITMIDSLITILQNCERSQKEYVYRVLYHIIKQRKQQISAKMPELIPIITNDSNSSIKEVKDNALRCLKAILKCSGNEDLIPFIPAVLEALTDSDKIPQAVEQLAGCVFVQNVEAAALSVTTPILIKGLNDRRIETKRKCCVIIDNMCKLVEHPKEIIVFSEKLRYLLVNSSENISDPEARSIATKALATIDFFYKQTQSADFTNKSLDYVSQVILEAITDNLDISKPMITSFGQAFNELLPITTNLCNHQEFTKEIWLDIYNNLIPEEIQDHHETICNAVLERLCTSFDVKEDIFEDTEEGLDLYKGGFSLAYGALTLLNNAKIHLKRNRFYGLLGPNNCGKTTLMRAIANEQIEGFPKRDELRTVFVEHEIQEREVGEDDKGFPILNIDLCGVDWVVDCCNEVYHMEPAVTRDAVEQVMDEIGFGNAKKQVGLDRAADMEMDMTTYSGGWKVKMQLCAATLMNADILMLDEPTGHLDTTNIAWIKGWLAHFIQKGGSIIATSHDSSFLNEMCTHLIDFQNRKLITFRSLSGEVLKDFVEQNPEKKGYFELKNDVVHFQFPDPTPLEGVKSASKSILRMRNIAYTYPTREIPTIAGVSIECSRISRVAVIGANGAGKSTAIKILIGEMHPQDGEIWKHPNARIAYIAQHAFQHLEKHLNKTPIQYILWRFAGNEDKENVDFLHNDVDETIVKKKYMVNPREISTLKECFGEEEDKHALEVDKILGRKENKKEKTKEYEVQFKNKSSDANMWVPREILVQMGCLAMVQRQDEKEAVAAGLISTPLTSSNVEKYLASFSVTAEQSGHTVIKSLSGGQKVKVVLAASLWQKPHIVILDEPTNYLDRDGLGALTKAIEEFKGGVIIISHNKEFANAVSQEKWIMEKGNLRKEGESVDKLDAAAEESGSNTAIGDVIVKDSYGNEIKVNKTKTLTGKEVKQEIKKLMKKIKDGKKKKTLTEEQIWALEEKVEELQAS